MKARNVSSAKGTKARKRKAQNSIGNPGPDLKKGMALNLFL
jgi:hypothetical protein